MESKLGFNLLRPQLSPEDRWDKIYEWVNSTARVIVILVELIVIVCFVARVIVDRTARDLEEVLEENKNQLDSLKDIEANIRELQKSLSDYENIWASSSGNALYIEEVYGYSPNLFRAYNVSLDGHGKMTISGVASEDDVQDLENTMKNSLSFSQVELSTFTPGGTGGDEPGEFQIGAVIADYKRGSLAAVSSLNQGQDLGDQDVVN